MTDPDKYRVFARAQLPERTPILAEAPAALGGADGTVVMKLYDRIDRDGGMWGVSAKEFSDALDSLPADTKEIELHIHSPGGMVWDGLAILNTLRQHPARVVAVIDGLAASAASFIAMGADEVVMAPNSEMMIHSPMGLAVGNAAVMQKMAEDLSHETDNLAAVYQAKAGGTLDDWRAAMEAETWYSAEEAVAAGLADRVLTEAPADQPKAQFDLTVFAHAGRAQAPAPKTPATPSASGSTTTAPKEIEMSLSDALRERLGIADETADEDTILAALDEALQEQADGNKPEVKPEETVAPAALAEVTRLSTELAEMKASQAKRDKDELFASWLRDGKTSPAEKAQMEAMYDAAPEQTRALVDARAKGSVVPVSTIGANQDDEQSEDDRLFAELFGAETKVS